METTLASLIVTTNDTSNVQSLFAPAHLSTSLTEVTSISYTELQMPSSSTKLISSAMDTLAISVLSTLLVSTLVFSTLILDSTILTSSILDSSNISISTPSVSIVSFFTTSPSISTIISILDTKAISVRIVEPKDQPSTNFLGKGKEIEEDFDLDEERVIPNLDIYKLTLYQMQTFGEILQKQAKQKRLREERDKEYKIIEDAKNILVEEIVIEVDSSQPILY